MKKMKKVMSLLLVMAMMTALVSGCANSGSSDAAGDTAAESTDAAAQADDATAESTAADGPTFKIGGIGPITGSAAV